MQANPQEVRQLWDPADPGIGQAVGLGGMANDRRWGHRYAPLAVQAARVATSTPRGRATTAATVPAPIYDASSTTTSVDGPVRPQPCSTTGDTPICVNRGASQRAPLGWPPPGRWRGDSWLPPATPGHGYDSKLPLFSLRVLRLRSWGS